jgi:hypothetical protein
MSGVDRIWAWEIDHERTPPNGYYATAEVGDATEYVRCDSAVLAALPEVQALVAEAVAQERERCAQVAQDRYLSWGDDSGVECDVTACLDIAAAIRKGGTE